MEQGEIQVMGMVKSPDSASLHPDYLADQCLDARPDLIMLAIENRDAYRPSYPGGHCYWEHDLKKIVLNVTLPIDTGPANGCPYLLFTPWGRQIATFTRPTA